jgi:MarR family transcriptional regulator, multiple antibiotic resistance protein MarR
MDAVRDTERALVVHMMPEVIARGLTAHQFWPLYYLARGSESHPAELARRLGITAPACTASIDQLVDADLIVRRRSATDRRQVVLALTPKGRRVLAAIWRQVDDWIEEATAKVSDEDIATAARVLRVVSDQLQTPRPSHRKPAEAT